jgi:hypothetical protein
LLHSVVSRLVPTFQTTSPPPYSCSS